MLKNAKYLISPCLSTVADSPVEVKQFPCVPPWKHPIKHNPNPIPDDSPFGFDFLLLYISVGVVAGDIAVSSWATLLQSYAQAKKSATNG